MSKQQYQSQRNRRDEDTFLFILFFLFSIWLLASCATVEKSSVPLTSLCIMDYEAKKCWVNKTLGKGWSFEEMKQAQRDCVGDSEFPCWYGVNSTDLKALSVK